MIDILLSILVFILIVKSIVANTEITRLRVKLNHEELTRAEEIAHLKRMVNMITDHITKKEGRF